MPSKRILPLLALFLGFLGVVICVAGIVATWSFGSRLSRTSENVFDGIDKTLAAVQERVLTAERRVQDAKIAAEDIRSGLKNWTRKETGERIASRLELEEKAGRLAEDLQQADLWLQMSGTSIQGVQQALELGSSMGAPVNAELVDPLFEKLAAVRVQLQQATETLAGVRQRAAEIAEGESPEERIDQAVRFALRVVATLGDIDSRLGEFANRLSETQTNGQHLKTKTHSYIVTAQLGVVLILAWMAIGQASLCRSGWGYQQAQSTS